MERRQLLVALAAGATLAGGSAFGQTSPAPAMKTDMPIAGLSDAVRAHIKDTMATGALSLALSRIALEKLKHPMTKQFATFEVAEQNTVADILKDRMTGAKPSGTVTPPTDAALQDAFDTEGKATVAKFREMAAGPAFEKAYVSAEVDGHKKLLAIQTTYLQVADDADETNVAKLVKGMVEEHLTLLSDIGKHLG